jgi:hypothetical protein
MGMAERKGWRFGSWRAVTVVAHSAMRWIEQRIVGVV